MPDGKLSSAVNIGCCCFLRAVRAVACNASMGQSHDSLTGGQIRLNTATRENTLHARISWRSYSSDIILCSPTIKRRKVRTQSFWSFMIVPGGLLPSATNADRCVAIWNIMMPIAHRLAAGALTGKPCRRHTTGRHPGCITEATAIEASHIIFHF